MALIKVESVSFSYLKDTPLEREALNDISFTIEKGEKIGIIGKTGSGKSTLIQLFDGLIYPLVGEIYIQEKEIKHWSSKELCRIVGLVFQYPEYQFFAETVFEEIAFGPKNIGVPEDKLEDCVIEALETVGLSYKDLKDRSPYNLSGGEKRRLAIASILAMKPEILILDEPTANLDPRGRKEIMEYIDKWARRGNTLILVSHDLDEVMRLVDRVIVLNKGILIFDGPIEELFLNVDKIDEAELEPPEIIKIVKALEEKGYPVKGTFTLPELAERIIAYRSYISS
ncbi:MAG TPA: energy-coupling factor transporter ATPase [Dictyoglomaceae bacterium]|nr:energy-coupling factor transporter ATPase [Dictyoglomaceae bacterium]HOL38808.1 energy-coupling factor transporter ATPase [Dictyoglomaceae bacterium]HOP94488.1 energy-coupling factor transporter ATPase [Dictyoglomaceae bacterium]HPP15444.1 energy-coupling factor transporter ATPase [Dictyoglomaceae bacterium]HPU43220.1 energy-coupling factor transporter ATPase [Dictyoglomaceae bacterium]